MYIFISAYNIQSGLFAGKACRAVVSGDQNAAVTNADISYHSLGFVQTLSNLREKPSILPIKAGIKEEY